MPDKLPGIFLCSSLIVIRNRLNAIVNIDAAKYNFVISLCLLRALCAIGFLLVRYINSAIATNLINVLPLNNG
jgi:hypothetical protein